MQTARTPRPSWVRTRGGSGADRCAGTCRGGRPEVTLAYFEGGSFRLCDLCYKRLCREEEANAGEVDPLPQVKEDHN